MTTLKSILLIPSTKGLGILRRMMICRKGKESEGDTVHLHVKKSNLDFRVQYNNLYNNLCTGILRKVNPRKGNLLASDNIRTSSKKNKYSFSNLLHYSGEIEDIIITSLLIMLLIIIIYFNILLPLNNKERFIHII